MPQPPASPVDPTNPTQTRGGKPHRQGDIDTIILELQKRVDALETIVSGGILFTSPDGRTTMRLTIDNAGNPVWTRQ